MIDYFFTLNVYYYKYSSQKMLSEIKENGINTSNDVSRLLAEVTHLEFVGDRILASGKDITLLKEFLMSACKKQKTSYSLSLRSFKITHYSKLSDKKVLSILRSYPNTLVE